MNTENTLQNAQDMINTLIGQRDRNANDVVQLTAQLKAAERHIAGLEAKVAELSLKSDASQANGHAEPATPAA